MIPGAAGSRVRWPDHPPHWQADEVGTAWPGWLNRLTTSLKRVRVGVGEDLADRLETRAVW